MILSELTVAVVQAVPVDGDLEANLRGTESLVEQLVTSAAGADLIVFPELSLTGYDLSLLADERNWFTPGDERLNAVRKIAAEHGTTVVVGAPVRVGEHQHIASMVLTGDAPDVVAAKTHLHGAENDLVEPGTGPVVISVAGWNVGLAVCYDTAFPAHAQQAKERGAQAYVASVLFTQGEERRLDVRMAARAVDHGMFSVTANLGGYPLGQRSAGGSGACAPDGTVLAVAAGRDQEVVTVRLDPALL
ncbi:carbon-nitrogen hydrolase family protein [Kineosporia babensis]|uniref:Carbon-nitrogen hydrolase family protein n=1 Tax=Kineosporia babensis TaxID=499548 RepID=A0A9X1SU06_9ACTN|nr:carbon-nitrogen hydrolase family protein [Kineosporia babensis]MCD5311891.1 carbon-nitrogen hydrolase family protein [Kineosporia babensis]